MAVLRQLNVLSQMRVDVPHLRSLESGVAADFDVLVGRGISGGKPLTVRGLTVAGLGTGVAATTLQLVVADAIVYDLNASEAGTMLWVPSDRAPEVLDAGINSRVSGGFAPNQTNYVGIDLVRASDTTTTDLVQFLDLQTLLETGKEIPLARTLDYRIVITTAPFSTQPNLIPVAKILTDSSNTVTSAFDARNLLFRLGSGGDAPDAGYAYPWPQLRQESTTLGNALFTGGDKAITSQKEWQDAVMTRLYELGGGEHWYSATADRNVNLVWVLPTFTNGENYEWVGGNLHWQGLRFIFDNSTVTYRDVQDQITDSAGLTNLADGDCIYVDLDRSTNATSLIAQKAALVTLGGSTPSRWVLAWRVGAYIYTRQWRYPVGTTFQPATNTSMGTVELNQPSLTPLAPKVFALNNYNGLTVGINFGADNGVVLTGTNNDAIQARGLGTGAGLVATSGSSAGAMGIIALGEGAVYSPPSGLGNGLYAQGGTTSNGAGVWGQAGGSGTGVVGSGGPTGGWGGSFSATFGNNRGLRAQGSGTEEGIKGVGGATGHGGLFYAALQAGNGTITPVPLTAGLIGYGSAAGEGLIGIGGNTGGTGVVGYGSNGTTGVGGWFTGGSSGGIGLRAEGKLTAQGVYGVGGATGFGAIFEAAASAGLGTISSTPSLSGVYGKGSASGEGVIGVGGNTGGTGVAGLASNGTNGVGVWGDGKGTGAGVRGDNLGGTGPGIYGTATGTKEAIVGESVNGSAVRGEATGSGTAIEANSSTGLALFARGGDGAGLQAANITNLNDGAALYVRGSHDHGGDIVTLTRNVAATGTEPYAVLGVVSEGSQYGIYSKITDPAASVAAACVFGELNVPAGATYAGAAAIMGQGTNYAAGGSFDNVDGEGPSVRVHTGGVRFKSDTLDANSGEHNTIVAANTPKAWGWVVTDGGGIIDVQNGYNMVATSEPNYIQVLFNTAMTDGEYSVVATVDADPGRFIVATVVAGATKNANGFRIQFYEVSPTPGQLNPDAEAIYVNFQVFAKQSL